MSCWRCLVLANLDNRVPGDALERPIGIPLDMGYEAMQQVPTGSTSYYPVDNLTWTGERKESKRGTILLRGAPRSGA